MFKKMGLGTVRLATVAILIAGIGAIGVAGGTSQVQAKELKQAFFASPKHPIWAKLMEPWGKAVEAAGVDLKVIGYPGSQIGGKPPGAFKRVDLPPLSGPVPMRGSGAGLCPMGWAGS